MATTLKLRRGTTAQHASFTGAEGEVTVDTDKDVVVVHDGSTAGGFPALRAGAGASVSSLTNSGNITFTGTGNRITGDFSNATVANRVMFQTSTTNGNTILGFIPNGTSVVSGLRFEGTSSAANNAVGVIQLNASEFKIDSQVAGTASYLPMTFYTGGSERVRIDSSGNVGIGTSSPGSYGKLAALTANDANTLALVASNGLIRMKGYLASASASVIEATNTAQSAYAPLFLNGSILQLGTDGTERARITDIGDLCVSTTGSENGNTKLSVRQSGAGNNGIWSHNTSTSDGASKFVATTAVTTASSGHFFYDAAYNWTTAFSRAFAVRGDGVIFALNTTVQALSDQRLKENVVDANDGLSVITALRPVRFDWKKETGIEKTNQLGFIAQEVEQVFPDAVDTYSSHDNPDDPYKSVGAGALIPVLVKAIQEQQALITALTTRITALENK